MGYLINFNTFVEKAAQEPSELTKHKFKLSIILSFTSLHESLDNDDIMLLDDDAVLLLPTVNSEPLTARG
jgi:hypothetical protein